MPYVGKSPDLNASVDTNELADDAVTLGKIGEDVKTAISGSFVAKADKSAISGSVVGGFNYTGDISGSAASTGSFGSIYTDKNVNASAFVGDGVVHLKVVVQQRLVAHQLQLVRLDTVIMQAMSASAALLLMAFFTLLKPLMVEKLNYI
jgi:hypothetical protein